ncbi:MAG: transpeptidase family protein [Saprospirales bacterium]|nr:transpeptidase family protein [Saprospirales bacterium]MBK8492366.1 transpeptidase family protein [Saprospirales bacterium]
MTTIRNEVLYRLYFVVAMMVIAAVVIFAKAVQISVLEGDYWREKSIDKYVQFRKLEADRGNILSSNGSLLATSLPFFDVAFDPNSSGMLESDFNKYIDSLSYCLADFVDPSFTPGAYRDFLIQKRQEGAQYVPIKKNVTFEQMKLIRQFPLFSMGQFKGGLIVMPKFRRERPFGLLAHRTIGYVREGITPVGLEGSFNQLLAGEDGQQLMMRVGDDIWKPIEDLAKIEPKSGQDVLTTIDIDIQDVTEEALYRAVDRHRAQYGVAIVMEVETGAIRAISNIGRTPEGNLWETYNYAVGSATEPGSTFKLATMLALLETGHVDLDDSIDIEQGRTKFYNDEMVDAYPHKLDSTSVQHIFEMSSNVGMAKLVQKYFGDTHKEEKFIEYLKQFNLHLKTGIEIEGEAAPYVKDAFDAKNGWSGTTLPWMATGYEVMLTPLQILNFYNAVANDGTLMKPYLVSETREYGNTLERFPPTVIKRKIASSRAIKKAQFLLEQVVLNGTAKKLKTDKYNFAGKTGTAQVNYKRLNDKTHVGGYQASFVGYFPAEKPKYSCVVLISEPKEFGIYGGEVALPVFREIADQIFATKLELQEPLNAKPAEPLVRSQLPDYNIGDRKEMEYLLKTFGIKYMSTEESPLVLLRAESDTLSLLPYTISKKRIPSVVGMGLRDALFVLENLGLRVEIGSGCGRVIQQSIKPGTPVRGQTVYLRLG